MKNSVTIAGILALTLTATHASATPTTLVELKAATAEYSVKCVRHGFSSSFGMFRNMPKPDCADARAKLQETRETYKLENNARRALWRDIVDDLAPTRLGFKPYILEAGAKPIRIAAHGVFVSPWKHRDFEFVAYNLPEIDGSAENGPPRFRVWRTNAIGKNKARQWIEGQGKRRVKSESLRRVKMGLNSGHMVVFIKVKEGGTPPSLPPGCYPAPSTYDEALERGC